VPSHDPHGKPATARGFCRYWDDYLHHGAPSPEALLIDPLALAQIWPQLTLREQQALHALAETGSYDAAAAAIGISRDHFSSLLSRARHHFLTLWHEHERPSGLWRRDQRTDKTGGSRRRAHKPDCACATCGQRRRRLAREHPTVATPTPVSSIELARGWPLAAGHYRT
jgi:hypothetical protein